MATPNQINLNVSFDQSMLNFLSNLIIIGYFVLSIINFILSKFNLSLVSIINTIVSKMMDGDENDDENGNNMEYNDKFPPKLNKKVAPKKTN